MHAHNIDKERFFISFVPINIQMSKPASYNKRSSSTIEPIQSQLPFRLGSSGKDVRWIYERTQDQIHVRKEHYNVICKM